MRREPCGRVELPDPASEARTQVRMLSAPAGAVKILGPYWNRTNVPGVQNRCSPIEPRAPRRHLDPPGIAPGFPPCEGGGLLLTYEPEDRNCDAKAETRTLVPGLSNRCPSLGRPSRQWSHRESNPDFKIADLASSHWTMTPERLVRESNPLAPGRRPGGPPWALRGRCCELHVARVTGGTRTHLAPGHSRRARLFAIGHSPRTRSRTSITRSSGEGPAVGRCAGTTRDRRRP